MNTTATATASTRTPKGCAIPWATHKGDRCPLPADAPCMVDLGDDMVCIGFADAFAWHGCAESDGQGRVLRYAPLVPVAYAPA